MLQREFFAYVYETHPANLEELGVQQRERIF